MRSAKKSAGAKSGSTVDIVPLGCSGIVATLAKAGAREGAHDPTLVQQRSHPRATRGRRRPRQSAARHLAAIRLRARSDSPRCRRRRETPTFARTNSALRCQDQALGCSEIVGYRDGPIRQRHGTIQHQRRPCVLVVDAPHDAPRLATPRAKPARRGYAQRARERRQHQDHRSTTRCDSTRRGPNERHDSQSMGHPHFQGRLLRVPGEFREGRLDRVVVGGDGERRVGLRHRRPVPLNQVPRVLVLSRAPLDR